MARATENGFSWPIACTPGVNCVGEHFRIGYPDVAGTNKSFSCGTPGYRGHHGTDIVVSSVEQDVRVLAAADGVVRWIKDGLSDHCPAEGKSDCNEENKTLMPLGGAGQASLGFNAGNYIVLEHKLDQIRYLTLYAHLRVKSLKVSEGQTVKRGEWIGNTGSSGNSLIPHLHFGVYREDGKFFIPIDPWKGPCNSSSNGLWISDPPYDADAALTAAEEPAVTTDQE